VTVYHGITPKEFCAHAEKADFKPELRHGDGETAIVEMQVHRCRAIAMLLVPGGGGRFNSVQFWIAWKDDLSIDEANRWNSMRRYAFAYRDESGHANLQMDFSVIGLADDGVDHYLGLWSHMIGSFMAEMA
jgi:Putative bacterial sensory transduction regulator